MAILKKEEGSLRGAWIGELWPGRSAVIDPPDRLPRLSSQAAPFDIERTAETRQRGGQGLNLEPLFQLACAPEHLEEGELRLVARVDEPLPGETITPAASQLRSATLVVAHLRYAPLPAARRDRNTRQDVAAADEDRLDLNFSPSD